ncbi:aspartate carbamoyltransferase [Azorhizophilus paspali]|uniref:Aspartate carbamoyltransferase n=1 Tax=Azorhizophilus paspali TaxID=69963 RepID=A0ABV6SI28_AZOPA
MERSSKFLSVLGLAVCLAGNAFASQASSERQAEVARRGAQVMPFALAQTTHIFERTSDGGIQKVVLKDGADPAQLTLIRRHLQEVGEQFARRDFSAPETIHGHDMPGLEALRNAAPGEMSVRYADIQDGAQLRFTAGRPELIHAIHAWIGAQLGDHGEDAVEGHSAHRHSMR